MKTLYLDCGNGAAGDMISAALWELTENKEEFIEEVNSIGIPGVKTYALPTQKQGIFGTHFRVTFNDIEETPNVLPKDAIVELTPEEDLKYAHHEHHHEHEHHSLGDVKTIIGNLNVSDKVKKDAQAVYDILAEAESHVHGTTVTEIHFHEVGNMDAIADIVCVCMLIEKLAPDQIIASSVNTGTGKVKCAHGILPIPAPATSYLLHGIPIYNTGVNGELCTPTGAALIKYFAGSFGPMPVMNIEDIGYGMGTKDYDVANYFRAFLGEAEDVSGKEGTTPRSAGHRHHHEHQVEEGEDIFQHDLFFGFTGAGGDAVGPAAVFPEQRLLTGKACRRIGVDHRDLLPEDLRCFFLSHSIPSLEVSNFSLAGSAVALCRAES